MDIYQLYIIHCNDNIKSSTVRTSLALCRLYLTIYDRLRSSLASSIAYYVNREYYLQYIHCL